MKLKLCEIQNLYQKLGTLSDKRLPFNASYAIVKNLKVLEAEMELIQKEIRTICETYSEKDEAGKPKMEHATDDNGREVVTYAINPEQREKANADLVEFLNSESNVELQTIKESDLKRCEEFSFDMPTLEEIAILLKFIVGD